MVELADTQDLGLAERKVRSVRALAPEVAYRRMHGALSRRGFSGHIVTRVLTELGITRS